MSKRKFKEPSLNLKGSMILFSTFVGLVIGTFMVEKYVGYLIIGGSFVIIGVLVGVVIRKANPSFGESVFEKVKDEATE